jgi:hypothetical protein
LPPKALVIVATAAGAAERVMPHFKPVVTDEEAVALAARVTPTPSVGVSELDAEGVAARSLVTAGIWVISKKEILTDRPVEPSARSKLIIAPLS